MVMSRMTLKKESLQNSTNLDWRMLIFKNTRGHRGEVEIGNRLYNERLIEQLTASN